MGEIKQQKEQDGLIVRNSLAKKTEKKRFWKQKAQKMSMLVETKESEFHKGLAICKDKYSVHFKTAKKITRKILKVYMAAELRHVWHSNRRSCILTI